MEKAVDIETRTFRHANVVRALAVTFGATTPEGVEIIKSKLKNFYSEGFAPPARGRGREIEYKFDDIMDWAIGLTLQELGSSTKCALNLLAPGCYASRFKERFASKVATGNVYIVRFCSLITDYTKWEAKGIPLIWEVAENEWQRDEHIKFAVQGGLSYAVSNFSQTREKVIAELGNVIMSGIRL